MKKQFKNPNLNPKHFVLIGANRRSRRTLTKFLQRFFAWFLHNQFNV